MTPPHRTAPDDDFYIGYEPHVPTRVRCQLRRVGAAGGVTLVVVALVAIAAHERLVTAHFDYGRTVEVAGRLERLPYPALIVDGQRVPLVGQGKHGGEAAVAHVPDGPVRLRATRAARGLHTLLEVVAGSVSRAPSSVPAGVTSAPALPHPDSAVESEITLVGEIVDSKCFLGVMNPGESIVHRDCARLCLLGGIPPMLLVRGGAGEEALIGLESRDGRALGAALAQLAGHPVRVHGRLRRDGNDVILATTAASVIRLAR